MMKSVVGYLLAAVVLLAIGLVALGVGRYERAMADAQEQMATEEYVLASKTLVQAKDSVTYATWVPGVGEQAQREVAAREAELRYWEGDYRGVVPEGADSAAAIGGLPNEVKLVAAHAAYRVALAGAKDRASAIQALDASIAGYLTVLRGETWEENAAYNYEYLVRLRDELAKSRRGDPPPTKASGSNGSPGAPAETADTRKFEIYVPLTGSERTKAGEAGKGEPNKRRG